MHSHPTTTFKARPTSTLRMHETDDGQRPDEVYEIIEGMFPDLAKVELYPKKPRSNWDSWPAQEGIKSADESAGAYEAQPLAKQDEIPLQAQQDEDVDDDEDGLKGAICRSMGINPADVEDEGEVAA